MFYVILPKVGTEDAVGIAASTKISSNTIKLAKLFMAKKTRKQTILYIYMVKSVTQWNCVKHAQFYLLT